MNCPVRINMTSCQIPPLWNKQEGPSLSRLRWGGLLWDESDVFDGISSRACAVRGCDVFELPAPWGPEQESAASALGVGAAGAPAPLPGLQNSLSPSLV